jgi:hypothetical protein
MAEHFTREQFAARAEALLGVPPDVVEALYPMVNDLLDMVDYVNQYNLRLDESFDESRLTETASGGV